MLSRSWRDVGPPMLTTLRAKVAVVVVAVATSMTVVTPAAHADLNSGVCTLDITVTFSTPLTSLNSSGWTMTAPSATSSCTIPGLGPTPTAMNAVPGIGQARCGAIVGVLGEYNQSWIGFGPSIMDGTNTVASSWLGGTMQVVGPSTTPLIAGVIQLVAPTENALKLSNCAKNIAVSSVRFTGIQVFTDP